MSGKLTAFLRKRAVRPWNAGGQHEAPRGRSPKRGAIAVRPHFNDRHPVSRIRCVDPSQASARNASVADALSNVRRDPVENALPYQFGARTTFAIEQDGVHCTIALPLSEPQTEESRMASSPLRERRILVVEDEYLIAISLQDALESVGSIVLGPAPSVDRAIKTIESEAHIHAAVLDVNLGGMLAYPVADMLIARKIPFVFTSGYEDEVIQKRYADVKNCRKPYLFPAMELALTEALSRS
jgi:CheY-like chemotaxis protein